MNKELIEKVRRWSVERGLDTTDPSKQRLKLWEEFGKLNAAIARDNREDAIDAIGNMLIVMIIYKQQLGYNSNNVFYPRKDNVHLLSRLEDIDLIECVGRGISDSQSCIECLGMVTENLTVLAYRLNTNLGECLATTYDEIKDRIES